MTCFSWEMGGSGGGASLRAAVNSAMVTGRFVAAGPVPWASPPAPSLSPSASPSISISISIRVGVIRPADDDEARLARSAPGADPRPGRAVVVVDIAVVAARFPHGTGPGMAAVAPVFTLSGPAPLRTGGRRDPRMITGGALSIGVVYITGGGVLTGSRHFSSVV